MGGDTVFQTWTVSSFKGCSHLNDITCPWGWGGVKIWDTDIFIFGLSFHLEHLYFTNTSLVELKINHNKNIPQQVCVWRQPCMILIISFCIQDEQDEQKEEETKDEGKEKDEKVSMYMFRRGIDIFISVCIFRLSARVVEYHIMGTVLSKCLSCQGLV